MSLMDELVKHSYVSILPSHAFTFSFGFLPSLFFCTFLLSCFHSSPCISHFWLLPNGIPTSLQIIVHFHKCGIITFGTGEFFLRIDKLSSHSLHSLLVKLRDALFDFVVFGL